MEFTGERVVEGKTPQRIWADHTDRYEFASKHVRGKTVLDIACGTGYGCRILHDKGKAKKVIGIDIQKDAINFARTKYEMNGIEFKVGDALRIDFPKNYFDVIVSFETIEHVKSPKKMISEFLRVLKTDGLLIISSPNRKLTSPDKSIEDQPDNPYHIREYSSKEFISVIGSYFEILEIYGQRAKNKLLFLPFFGKILRFCFPLLYDPGTGSSKLKRVRSMKEYRYFIVVCKKPRSR